jgi:hypothetical protein
LVTVDEADAALVGGGAGSVAASGVSATVATGGVIGKVQADSISKSSSATTLNDGEKAGHLRQGKIFITLPFIFWLIEQRPAVVRSGRTCSSIQAQSVLR